MRSIIRWFTERSFVVNLLSAAICTLGVVAAWNLKRDLIPAWEFRMVRVLAVMPGATPAEMERHVTWPLEQGLRNLVGLEKVSSDTRAGLADISLLFTPEHEDIGASLEDARNILAVIRPQLPDSLTELKAVHVRVDQVLFMSLAYSGIDVHKAADRERVRNFSRRLENLPGIVRTEHSLPGRNLYIEFSPQSLRRYQISASQARAKVAERLAYIPIGGARQDENQHLIEIRKSFTDTEAIRRMPLMGNRGGRVVRLGDVARVEMRFPPDEARHELNGNPVIRFLLFKSTASDAIALQKLVQKLVNEENSGLQDPLRVSITTDGPSYINQQLQVLMKNGLSGLLLVVIILALSLGLRTSLVTVLGIPIAYLGAAIVFYLLGVSLDLISVVGMILILGILVDDAIIVADKYRANLDAGQTARDAAVNAACDLIVPVTGTIVTTMVAFSPMLFMKSDVSNIFRSIPLVIIAALALSWIDCFFILPNHLQHLVPTRHRRPAGSGGFFTWLRGLYTASLRVTQSVRYGVFTAFLVLLVGCFWLAVSRLDQNYAVRVGEERLTILAVLKKSASLDETSRTLRPLSDWLNTLTQKKAVDQVSLDVGRIFRGAEEISGFRYARFSVDLSDRLKHPGRTRVRLQKIIENRLPRFRTAAFEKLEVEVVRTDRPGDQQRPVKIRILGDERLDQAALLAAARRHFTGIHGLERIEPATQDEVDLWQFLPDKRALERYRLSWVDLSLQLRQAVGNERLMEMRSEGRNFTVFTRSGRAPASGPGDLDRLSVATGVFTTVPVSWLGKWERRKTLKLLRHEDLQRLVELRVDYRASTDRDRLLTAMNRRLPAMQADFPHAHIRLDRGDALEKAAREWIFKVAGICALLVSFILALTMGSVTKPLLVAPAMLFGYAGIILSLYAHSMELGLMVMIGFVGVMGVSVNDSLIMVDAIASWQKRHPGEGVRTAVLNGAPQRLRAMVLTTVSTMGGVLPMAYGLGGESGFTSPMAFAMGWGICAATLLTLYVVPAMVEIHDDISGLFRRKKPSPVLSEGEDQPRPEDERPAAGD